MDLVCFIIKNYQSLYPKDYITLANGKNTRLFSFMNVRKSESLCICCVLQYVEAWTNLATLYLCRQNIKVRQGRLEAVATM